MTNEPDVSGLLCAADDMRADTLGMWPCPHCGQLTYEDHEPGCDAPPHEQDRMHTEEMAERYNPDVGCEEVAAMLDDPGLVDYMDPLCLQEGEEREETVLTMVFDVLDAWVS